MVKFDIEKIMLIGRTYDEYKLMFKLGSIKGKILDVGSGASSFTAESSKKGLNVVAVDPIYLIEPEILEKKCKNDLEEVIRLAIKLEDQYKWKFFKDVSMLKRFREKAYKLFIEDYKKRRNNYIYGNLPKLPFQKDEFSLVLCSHFLFLYDDRLSYEFHKKSIKEMLRVTSKEVRIFPLVNLSYKKSKYLNKIIDEFNAEIVKVPYEFIKGGFEMLKISKK